MGGLCPCRLVSLSERQGSCFTRAVRVLLTPWRRGTMFGNSIVLLVFTFRNHVYSRVKTNVIQIIVAMVHWRIKSNVLSLLCTCAQYFLVAEWYFSLLSIKFLTFSIDYAEPDYDFFNGGFRCESRENVRCFHVWEHLVWPLLWCVRFLWCRWEHFLYWSKYFRERIFNTHDTWRVSAPIRGGKFIWPTHGDRLVVDSHQRDMIHWIYLAWGDHMYQLPNVKCSDGSFSAESTPSFVTSFRFHQSRQNSMRVDAFVRSRCSHRFT